MEYIQHEVILEGTDEETIRKEQTIIKSILNNTNINQEYIFFWKPDQDNGYFSQWFKSSFMCNGLSFSSAEQFMMYNKAKIAGDSEYEALIINSPDAHPGYHKRLGRSVRNLDHTLWNSIGINIVIAGNLCKFTQDEQLKELLISTDNKTLVEASPYDKIWGIGFSREDAMQNIEIWNDNRLGKALMIVRRMIIQNPEIVISNLYIEQ